MDNWFTASGEPGPALLDCLKAATAAPSIHNTQPWLFRVRDGIVDVLADHHRRLTVLDPDGREMYVSVGAAVFTLRVALRAAGRPSTVRLLPEPDVAARVEIGPAAPPSAARSFAAARALAGAIPRRHTNRRPFADKPIPFGTMEELAGAATAEGASLLTIGPELRDGVLSLTRTADNRMRSDPAYLAELGAWTTPPGIGRRDGVPRQAFGPRATDSRLPLRDLGLGNGAPTGSVDFEPDPTLVALFTPDDTVADWLRAGAALQRLWLTATVRGLAATPMTQLTEVSALRALLADSFTRYVAQSVLRLGFPLTPAVATPRRPLAEILV
jgi:nitroreductase